MESFGTKERGSHGGGCNHPLTGVGAIILNDSGEVLLMLRGTNLDTVRNEWGHWEFPGGELELWEKLEEAVRREVQEEIGCEIIIIDQLPAVDDIMQSIGQHWITHPFLAVLREGSTPTVREPTKCDAVRWFQLDELPEKLSGATKHIRELYAEIIDWHLHQISTEKNKVT